MENDENQTSQRDASPTAHCSRLDSKAAWHGRDAELKILGKKSVNGKSFTEKYSITVSCEGGSNGWNQLLETALASAKSKTAIPADLVEGVSFKFVS